MKHFILGLAQHVRSALLAYANLGLHRTVHGDSPGGDAQFDIDEVAETAARDYCFAHAPCPLAIYTEDQSLLTTGPAPEVLLIIDPIDGTRPASANLEMAMISIACASYHADSCLDDVHTAVLMEIKSGAWICADTEHGLDSAGFSHSLPQLSNQHDLAKMFWSIEFNGHPMQLMSSAYGHLVDGSANSGGVFVFNSSTFSISRIITGQLDAYVDIGNRILRDHPQTEPEFRKAGRGSILHLFPYDIAAAVFIARHAGVIITDAYGASLGETRLMDLTPFNQKSCIAAANRQLHEALMNNIRW